MENGFANRASFTQGIFIGHRETVDTYFSQAIALTQRQALGPVPSLDQRGRTGRTAADEKVDVAEIR